MDRALFAAVPEKYAPQYGGYCAYAMASGNFVRVDPAAWHVFSGELYLNFSTDVRKRWLADRQAYIDKADSQWKRLRPR